MYALGVSSGASLTIVDALKDRSEVFPELIHRDFFGLEIGAYRLHMTMGADKAAVHIVYNHVQLVLLRVINHLVQLHKVGVVHLLHDSDLLLQNIEVLFAAF